MRQQHQLVYSRARIRPRYALIPEEGIPASRLPHWPDAKVYVQGAPALGAGFAQYRIELDANQGGQVEADGDVEHFIYVCSGAGSVRIGKQTSAFGPGFYALVPPTEDYRLTASESTSLLLVRKKYEPLTGIKTYPVLIGNQANIMGESFLGDPGANLQLLIPDELQFDLAMNIFTFEVGHGLPYVETHVMEHGLYFLQGKGVYFLDDAWMEVEATDFIWMGPYCPQSFYATGPAPSKYIYYKNVNREIRLG